MDAPVFDQVNLIVRDMPATLAFYRALGVSVPDDGDEWPPGTGAMHVDVRFPDGPRLEFDNEPMADIWHPARTASTRVVLGMSFASREAVDERYAALTSAGYTGLQPPYDAFWGSRYAIVADPDGNAVGLMSPPEAARKYIPSGVIA
jgi:uncharacterized glyoxalase superfamily protein PhnB